MRKLYIPTSSLNFNNILACESISPLVFYSKRNFGYKTFELVKPNNFTNSILLYDKLPIFEIDDKERDNYPMIIEIDCNQEDFQSIKRINDVTIYQGFETIYLNPFYTNFFFLSQEAQKITLLGSERSLNTKLVYLYENCNSFHLIDDSTVSFNFNNDFLIDKQRDFPSGMIDQLIDIDQRKNRAKGFMYSYLLGANRSLNKELITIKKCTKDIGNIVSAVLNSPNKALTNIQKKSLTNLSLEFSRAYEKIDDDKKRLNEKIEVLIKLTNNTFDSAKKLIESFGFSWEDALNNVANQYRLHKPFDIHKELEYNFENFPNVINEIVLKKENLYLLEKKKFNIIDHVVLANLKLTFLSEEKTDFFTALINEFLSNDYQNEKKVDIAVRGIMILKNLLKENNRNWEDSPQRFYYNELLANLQGRGSFDVLKEENIIRQSFALFILYKDDIEKIESSLIANLIPEYRFAFGLWGAVFGFSNMPKTITNDLFLSDDIIYISEVYKYIHKQIHGIELVGKVERKMEDKTIIKPSKINSITFPNQLENENFSDNLNQKTLEFYNKLEENCKSVKLDKEIYIRYIEKYGISIQLIEILKSDKRLSKGKGVQKNIISFLEKEINPKKVKSNKQLNNISTIQFYQSTGNFLRDFDFLSNNQEFIKSVFKSSEWKKDLKWFIESHEKSHNDYEKYWKGKPIDNESIIKQFIFLRKEKYKDSEKLLRQLYISNEL